MNERLGLGECPRQVAGQRLAAREGTTAAERVGIVLEEHVPVRRRRLDRRRLTASDQCAHPGGSGDVLGPRHDHRRAVTQRQENLDQRRIERERGRGQLTIAGTEWQAIPHSAERRCQ